MSFLPSGRGQDNLDNFYESPAEAASESKAVFIAESPVMKSLHNKIKELAFLSSPILILGESGSGREAAAREIFNADISSRSKKFIKLACWGMDQKAIEQNLFGGKSEALLQSGQSSVLFIKGLGRLNPLLQRRLLHCLSISQGKDSLPRLICSASENLSEKVKEGRFSEELFKILCQNLLILPPLSERTEDIPYLAAHFNRQNGFPGRFSEEALDFLKDCAWKGNITELKNLCLQIAIMRPDQEFISKSDLAVFNKKPRRGKEIVKYDPSVSLDDLINIYIQMSLNHFNSKKASAAALGISIKTIYNKIKSGYIKGSPDCGL